MTEIIMARSLAPEDILPGTYIMVLHEQRELLHPANPAEGDVSPVVSRVLMRPCETGLPRLVLEVNLPFVVVKNHERKTEVLDIRGVRLVRVSKRFARAAVEPHLDSDEGNPSVRRCEHCNAR
jgi:hypothetical protein